MCVWFVIDVKPNLSTFTALLDAFTRTKQFHRIKPLLRRMHLEGMYLDQVLRAILLFFSAFHRCFRCCLKDKW